MPGEAPKIDAQLREAARVQGTDLDSRANAFTVWMISGQHTVFCGRRDNETGAWELARSLTQLKSLYILPANSRKRAIAVPDADRRPEPARPIHSRGF
jgi:hypothetical protein